MRIERGSLVLVTGGAGFLGAEVVRQLLAEGYRVRVLDDLSRGARERLAGLDVELLVDDVRSERAVVTALQGAAGVVHLAAPTPSPRTAREERLAHEVTVTGTLSLCAAARAEGVAKLVLGSSAAVYGRRTGQLLHEDVAPDPVTVEGAQRLAAETYVRMFGARDGLAAVTLRFFSVYGAGQDGAREDSPFVARFVHQAAAGEAITIHGDGLQVRDLVHVTDAARAAVVALATPGVVGRTFNVASGTATSVRQVASLLGELLGRLPAPRYAPARPGDPPRVQASIAAASAALGLRPRLPLRDGLRAWCQARGGLPAPARTPSARAPAPRTPASPATPRPSAGPTRPTPAPPPAPPPPSPPRGTPLARLAGAPAPADRARGTPARTAPAGAPPAAAPAVTRALPSVHLLPVRHAPPLPPGAGAELAARLARGTVPPPGAALVPRPALPPPALPPPAPTAAAALPLFADRPPSWEIADESGRPTATRAEGLAEGGALRPTRVPSAASGRPAGKST